jgi:hypothetical protein
LADKPKRARDLINVSEEVEEDIAKLAEEIFGGRKNDKTVN